MKKNAKNHQVKIDLFNLEKERISGQALGNSFGGAISDDPGYLICLCQHYLGEEEDTMHYVR